MGHKCCGLYKRLQLVLFDRWNPGLLAVAAAVFLTLSGCSHPLGMEDSPMLISLQKKQKEKERESEGEGEKTGSETDIYRERESEIVAWKVKVRGSGRMTEERRMTELLGEPGRWWRTQNKDEARGYWNRWCFRRHQRLLWALLWICVVCLCALRVRSALIVCADSNQVLQILCTTHWWAGGNIFFCILCMSSINPSLLFPPPSLLFLSISKLSLLNTDCYCSKTYWNVYMLLKVHR